MASHCRNMKPLSACLIPKDAWHASDWAMMSCGWEWAVYSQPKIRISSVGGWVATCYPHGYYCSLELPAYNRVGHSGILKILSSCFFNSSQGKGMNQKLMCNIIVLTDKLSHYGENKCILFLQLCKKTTPLLPPFSHTRPVKEKANYSLKIRSTDWPLPKN